MNIYRLIVKICLFASVLYAINIILDYAVSQSVSSLSLGMTSAMVGLAAIAAKRDRANA